MKKTNKRILVAEDDRGVLDALKTILEMEGFTVETIMDGNGLQKLGKPLPDLLLLDVWMGRCDGREICKNLKRKAETRHLPIILVSATRDLEKSALEAGADDFLAKPFEVDDLISKVRKFI